MKKAEVGSTVSVRPRPRRPLGAPDGIVRAMALLQQLRRVETEHGSKPSLFRSPGWARGNVTIDSELVDFCLKDDFFHGLAAKPFCGAGAFRVVSETCHYVPPFKSEPLSHSHFHGTNLLLIDLARSPAILLLNLGEPLAPISLR